MSVTGQREAEPQKVGVAVIDVIAGLFAITGIVAGLRHRDRTGEGQRVEVDLLSSVLAALVNQSSAYTAAGVVPQRMGNEHPSIAPYELLSTARGELVVAVGNDRQFGDLCRVLGVPDLAEDPRFATNDQRVGNRRELRSLLEERLAAAPASEWSEPLLDAGVPAGEVNDVAGAFALAERLGLDPIVELAAGERHSVRLPRNPVRMSRTPARHETPPPELGELEPGEALDLAKRARPRSETARRSRGE